MKIPKEKYYRETRRASTCDKVSGNSRFCCLFAFGCAESLLLGGPFSSCSRWGPLLIALHRILIAAASSIAEHRREGTELQ